MSLIRHAGDLAFSSREMLRLIEAQGLTGNWSWIFATNEHAWSPGLYRLLGLEPGAVRPSYDLLLNFVHPGDRPGLESAAQVAVEGVLREHRLIRIIRPDGTMRLLSSSPEVCFAPDGRPRAAVGTLLDVTDREALASLQAVERRRRAALFEQAHIFTFTRNAKTMFVPPQEALRLTGFAYTYFAEDAFRVIPAAAREHWRGMYQVGFQEGRSFTHTHPFVLADGQPATFRTSPVPIRDAAGTLTEWIMVVQPSGRVPAFATDRLREALEQAIDADCLRAARALLDWSMLDLARASGLSFSTVRRLEEGEAGGARSRHRAVAALRAAGIRFSLREGSAVAVAKV